MRRGDAVVDGVVSAVVDGCVHVVIGVLMHVGGMGLVPSHQVRVPCGAQLLPQGVKMMV